MNIKRIPLWATALCALALGAALLLAPMQTQDTAASEASGDTPLALSDRSEVLQTLTYSRCSHTVTRRFTAPVELYGQPLEGVQALYPQWKVTEFSAAMVKMEQHVDLFCPDHLVLMTNGEGRLCVFENTYGEALMLLEELDVMAADLPAAAREEAERGVGFAAMQEVEQWLEGAQS